MQSGGRKEAADRIFSGLPLFALGNWFRTLFGRPSMRERLTLLP